MKIVDKRPLVIHDAADKVAHGVCQLQRLQPRLCVEALLVQNIRCQVGRIPEFTVAGKVALHLGNAGDGRMVKEA